MKKCQVIFGFVRKYIENRVPKISLIITFPIKMVKPWGRPNFFAERPFLCVSHWARPTCEQPFSSSTRICRHWSMGTARGTFCPPAPIWWKRPGRSGEAAKLKVVEFMAFHGHSGKISYALNQGTMGRLGAVWGDKNCYSTSNWGHGDDWPIPMNILPRNGVSSLPKMENGWW